VKTVKLGVKGSIMTSVLLLGYSNSVYFKKTAFKRFFLVWIGGGEGGNLDATFAVGQFINLIRVTITYSIRDIHNRQH